MTGNLFVPIAFVNTSSFGTPNDTVSILNVTSNTVTEVTVGESPETPVYDPVNNEMYVACQVPSDNFGVVTALNATTGQVVATIGVGTTPVVPVFDSTNDELYVPNFISNNLSVIGAGPVNHVTGPGTYPVTFAETGLPSGAWWNVELDGTTLNGTAPSIVFNAVHNGSHPWRVGPWADMSKCDFTGSLTQAGWVNFSGAAQTVPMPFSCSGSGAGGGGGSTSSFLGLSGDDGYYLLGGIAIVVVAGIAGSVLYLRGHRGPKGPGGTAGVPPPPPGSGGFPPPPPPPPPPP